MTNGLYNGERVRCDRTAAHSRAGTIGLLPRWFGGELLLDLGAVVVGSTRPTTRMPGMSCAPAWVARRLAIVPIAVAAAARARCLRSAGTVTLAVVTLSR